MAITKLFVAFVVALLVSVPASAQLAHDIPDFGTQAGCTTVTTSRDYAGTTAVECLVITGGTTRVLAGATVTIDTWLVNGGTLIKEPGGEIVTRDGPLSRPNDPLQWQRGIICLTGSCQLHGTEKTPTARLTAAPVAGSTILAMIPPADWAVGDEIALHSSHQPAPNHEVYQPRPDICRIVSKAVAGITCATPLLFSHPGRGPHLPIVANLTRDTTIRSANPNGVRGHVACVGVAVCDVRGVEFRDMGRTTFAALTVSPNVANLIGRYALHFHHYTGPPTTADPYQFVARGNVIRGSTVRGEKWGIAIHDAHYGLVENNVVWQMGGAGIVTEDGSETQNTIRHNWVGEIWGAMGFSTDNHKSTDRSQTGDWGWEGSCYWFRGPANLITENYCGGAVYGLSFVLHAVTVAVPTARGQVPSLVVNMQTVPLTRVEDTEISGALLGVNPWNLGANCCTTVFELPESVFRRMTVWNTRRGYYGYAQNRVTVDGWIQRSDPGRITENSYGFFWGDYIAPNVIIRNALIEDVRTGIIAPYKPGQMGGLYGSDPGTMLIENTTIRAATALFTGTMYGTTGGGVSLPPRLVTVRNSTLTPTASSSTWIERAHLPDGTNANWTVSDRLVLENVNSLTGEVFYPVQATQNFYGVIAPATAVTHPNMIGLWNAGGSVPLPPPPPPPPPPPVNCVVSDWGPWSAWTPISSTTEQRTRTRTVITPASNGGTPCPPLTETETRPIVVVPPPDPCVVTPLTLSQISWPSSNSGRRSLTFNSSRARRTVHYEWADPDNNKAFGVLTVTDVLGCSVTVVR